MPSRVLGEEWGALAGKDPEEALRIVTKYAEKLEAGGRGEEDEPSSRDVAKDLKGRQSSPLTVEFLGKREGARAQGRAIVEGQGKDWNKFAAAIETIMSNVSPEQQTDGRIWAEAWWHLWGIAQREAELAPPAAEEEGEPKSPPRSEKVVTTVGGERGNRSPRGTTVTAKIEDPEERRVKSNFEKLLGQKISDDEWIALQDDVNPINTVEQYNELQDSLKPRSR